MSGLPSINAVEGRTRKNRAIKQRSGQDTGSSVLTSMPVEHKQVDPNFIDNLRAHQVLSGSLIDSGNDAKAPFRKPVWDSSLVDQAREAAGKGRSTGRLA